MIGSFSASIDLAGVQAAERDLGRGDEVQVVILDAVDLRLRPAGNEADALEHVAAGQVGRDHRREAFAHQQLDRVLLQRELQQRGFVLEEVEAVAGDAGAAFEIDQVVLLGQRDVIEHREAERPDVDLAAAQLLARVLAADGRFGMRQVRHRVVDRPPASAASRSMCSCDLLLHLAQPAAFVLAGLALGIVLRLADRLADRVRQPRKLFDLGLQLPPLRFQLDEPRNVDLHAAAVAVLLNELGVFENESFIEHASEPAMTRVLTTEDTECTEDSDQR